MRIYLKSGLACLAALIVASCNLTGLDESRTQALQRELDRLNATSERLAAQVAELRKHVADLGQEVQALREERIAEAREREAVRNRPSPPPRMEAEDRRRPKEVPPPGPRAPSLCDAIETHITAMEGILSHQDLDSLDILVDDLEAAFSENLKKFSSDPRIPQIKSVAAAMRGNFLTAAKQSQLAMNPYLRNIRQAQINEGREAARTLRSLCRE